jgi:hypothetical protein
MAIKPDCASSRDIFETLIPSSPTDQLCAAQFLTIWSLSQKNYFLQEGEDISERPFG